MAEQCGELLRTKSEVEWNIPKFFEVTEYVRSPFFAFRGASLYVELFPKGRKKSRDHISIYLMRKDAGSPRKLTFRLSLKSADGTLIDLIQDTRSLPDGRSSGWGNKKAFQISELLERKKELVPSDVLTVVCFISMYPEQVKPEASAQVLSECSVFTESSTEFKKLVESTTQTESEYLHPETVKETENIVETSNQMQSENCIEKLSHDLNGLLASGEDSDMVVLVKGTEFRLHRGIMGARTPVFHSMFRNEMKEKATGTVSIDDCDADAFRAFAYYVYSGRVDQLCTDTVFDLFVLADKYQTDELKSACLDFVKRSLSVDTFCEVVTMAVTFGEKELLQQATGFLASNMTEVMQTVKWMNFLREYHIVANELMLKAVSMKK